MGVSILPVVFPVPMARTESHWSSLHQLPCQVGAGPSGFLTVASVERNEAQDQVSEAQRDPPCLGSLTTLLLPPSLLDARSPMDSIAPGNGAVALHLGGGAPRTPVAELPGAVPCLGLPWGPGRLTGFPAEGHLQGTQSGYFCCRTTKLAPRTGASLK